MTTFAEALAEIPFTPTTPEATGLVAPIFRAVGHIMYVMGATAEESYNLTPEETQRELAHASTHLVGTPNALANAPISGLAKARIRSFCEAVDLANAEFNEWAEEDRAGNLKALADRAAALGSFFDLELAGVRDSNPGRSL